MHYLAGRFGSGFITAFHRDPDQGLVSLRKLVAGVGADATAVIRDWAAMIALDGVLDRGYSLAGAQPGRYRTPTLSAEVDWRNPSSFSASGAPPNGSDYLRFRRPSGLFLTSRPDQLHYLRRLRRPSRRAPSSGRSTRTRPTRAAMLHSTPAAAAGSTEGSSAR